MRVLIIDGQGGRIGSALAAELLEQGFSGELFAVGTNSLATMAMQKAGVRNIATGENPVVVNCRDCDVIVGPIGIIAADSLMGEITPTMAMAVSSSRAHKILIPMNNCHIAVAGVAEKKLSEYITETVSQILHTER